MQLQTNLGHGSHPTKLLLNYAALNKSLYIDEQNEITNVFAALERKENDLRHRHAALTNLFRSLLHKLMTAQIRVNELDWAKVEKVED
jgi:hypothetical protein